MRTLDEQIEDAKRLIVAFERAKLIKSFEGHKGDKTVTGAKAEPELPKRWTPSIEDNYYSIGSTGEILSIIWYADSNDLARYGLGNVYKTREEAEFEIKCRKVEFELREYIYEHGGGDGEFVVESNTNFYLYYGHLYAGVDIDLASSVQKAHIYCNSKEVLREAVQTIGEERIKKYYLRVKE